MLLRVILLSCVLCAAVALETSNLALQSINENTCSESQWRCADGGCIPKEGRCNAAVDCKDASDEYLDTCHGVTRPVFTLQLLCWSLWTKSQPICPQICYDQPAFCHYTLTAEIGQMSTCRFPKYPAHGKYTVQPLPVRQADGFRLHYKCDQSYSLVETERLDCVNGAWVNEDKPRYCTEACRLYKSDNFTYACEGNSCGNHVPVGTVVTVTRKGTAAPVSVQILCNEDKTFNISTDCLAEIENIQQNFENPTMVKMTEYESRFNQMKNDETNHEFQSLVDQYHRFEDQVRGKLTMMIQKSEECDMYLDLLLYNLSMEQKLF